MMKIKLRNFITQEFVPRLVYQRRGDAAIECMDNRILNAVDLLRDNLRSLGHDNGFTINNWHIKGERQYSGLRTPESEDYSVTSQHTFGRALDVITKTPLEVIHLHIIDNPYIYSGIKFIEIDIGWLHIDCRQNVDGSELNLWSPKRGLISVEQYRAELKKA